MIRNSNVRIIGDMEFFIDSLLAHTEEENCQHSISDFLQEYFDNKNKIGIGVGRPETSSNNQTAFEANDNSNPNLTEEEDD